jgi:hypothetical protein
MALEPASRVPVQMEIPPPGAVLRRRTREARTKSRDLNKGFFLEGGGALITTSDGRPADHYQAWGGNSDIYE